MAYWALYTTKDEGKSWTHEMDFVLSWADMKEELGWWEGGRTEAKAVRLKKAQWEGVDRQSMMPKGL